VGPRQSAAYGMVLPRFLEQALAGEALTVFGDGSQTRCFAAAAEVVRSLAGLLALKAAHGRVFNVGSDREITVSRLARIVADAVGGGVGIARVPLEEVFPRGFVDPPRRVPCLRRLREALGWAPSRPVEEIVGELVAERRAAGAAPAQAPGAGPLGSSASH